MNLRHLEPFHCFSLNDNQVQEDEALLSIDTELTLCPLTFPDLTRVTYFTIEPWDYVSILFNFLNKMNPTD